MPMDVEFCATCGCSEFSHYTLDDEGDRFACECGRCDDYTFIEEPMDLVCTCGCEEYLHGRGGDRRCEVCDDCSGFEAHGTVLDKVRAEAEARAGERPDDPAELTATASSLQLDWLDEPVEVVAAVLTDEDGRAVRVDRPPRAGERVAVYLARTSDGLEIAVSHDELEG